MVDTAWRQSATPDEFHRFSLAGTLIGLGVAGTGAWVLVVGWGMDVPAIKSVFPGSVTMKANTAAAFVLVGLSLTLWGCAARVAWGRYVALASAAATALVGILTLGEYLSGVDLGIDQILFRAAPGAGSTLPPGRMTPASAASFLLLGGALIFAGWRRTLPAAQRLVLFSGLIGLLAALGHLYGVTATHGIGQYTQMAIHSTVLMMLLSAGVHLLHPDDGFMRTLFADTMGGWLLRRMAPFVFGGPIVLGWLWVRGEQSGYFEGPLGVALMITALIFLFTILLWWTARTLTRMDMARQKLEAEMLQAVANRRESDAQFMAVLYASSDAILLIEDGKFVDCNEATVRMLGYHDKKEMLMTHPSELSPPKQPDGRSSGEKAEEMIATVLKRGVFHFEWMHRKANGEDFLVQVTLTAILGSRGNRLHCVWRDMTQERRREEALRESQELIERIINAIPVRVYWKDTHLTYLGCNAAFARDAGFADPKDLVGKDDFEMGWRAQAELVREIDRQILKSGESRLLYELPQTTPEGKRRTVLINKIPLRNARGEIHGVLGTYMDITERKDAEEALQKSEQRVRLILESAGEAIIGLDSAGHVTDCNPSALRLFCFGALGEIIGKSLHQLVHHTRADGTPNPDEQCPVHKAVIRGESCAFDEEMLWRADGSNFWATYRTFPLRSGERIVGAVATVVDLTERKRVELIERQRQAMANAVAAMEQVLGIVAHELRTPLAGIRAISELLLDFEVNETVEFKAYMGNINQEVIRMSETVNSLLDAARINSGQAQWNWGTVDLAEVCQGAVATIRPLLDPNEVALTLDIKPPDAQMKGDANAIQRLLVNLVRNAQKNTTRGRIEVQVNCQQDDAGQWVEMEIRDTGAGIPPAIAQRLGEAFALNSGMVGANHVKGTGLGLAICKAIIGVHGGTLSVQSAVGVGTTITTRLRADLPGPASDKVHVGFIENPQQMSAGVSP
jgi:PAS domain S-box-containing protein